MVNTSSMPTCTHAAGHVNLYEGECVVVSCTELRTSSHKSCSQMAGHLQTCNWTLYSRRTVNCLMSHSTQNRSFRRRSSQPMSWLVLKKPNLTHTKQTFIRNTKILQNKKVSKVRFGHLIWPPSWKWASPILQLLAPIMGTCTNRPDSSYTGTSGTQSPSLSYLWSDLSSVQHHTQQVYNQWQYT